MGLAVVEAEFTVAPHVPPPITRREPVLLRVKMDSQVTEAQLEPPQSYDFWTFSGTVPGPFIRARVGDTMEVELTNKDESGMLHNLDFHSVCGPGGGAPLLTVGAGETKHAWFKLLHPGLFIYHCAVDPVGMHIANGMYGMMLVEPDEGLPPVDKEFFVLQSEFYTEQSPDDPMKLELAWNDAMKEQPTHVVFNGRVGALAEPDNMLQVNTGERVRIYFGNIGPNLVSSFHIIGMILEHVYREGDVQSPPAKSLQTTLVPAGGVTIVEFTPLVPGVYTLVDHSIMRTEKGAVGFLNVTGEPRKDIFTSSHPPKLCANCKIHP